MSKPVRGVVKAQLDAELIPITLLALQDGYMGRSERNDGRESSAAID